MTPTRGAAGAGARLSVGIRRAGDVPLCDSRGKAASGRWHRPLPICATRWLTSQRSNPSASRRQPISTGRISQARARKRSISECDAFPFHRATCSVSESYIGIASRVPCRDVCLTRDFARFILAGRPGRGRLCDVHPLDIAAPTSHAGRTPTAVASRRWPLSPGEACVLPAPSRQDLQSHAFGGRIHEAMPCQRLRTRRAIYRARGSRAGPGSELAPRPSSTGKIEGRVRDQAGAPIAKRPGVHRGDGVQRPHEPAGLLLHQQRARRHDLGPGRLHRVQVHPG